MQSHLPLPIQEKPSKKKPRLRYLALNRQAFFAGLTVLTLLLSTTNLQATQNLSITGTGSGTGGMALLAQAYMEKNPAVQVEVLTALGSTGGIRALMAGKIDIAVSNRQPREKELAAVPLNFFTYARTPLVIAAHRSLGVASLTSDQLAALYNEDSPTFPNGKRARPVLRKSDSTDTRLVESISPAVAAGVKAASTRRGMLDGTTDSNTADLLEKIPGAFGPSTLALIESEGRPLIAFSIDGKEPTLTNIKNGQWKWQKPLIMVTQAKPSPQVQQFVDFVLSNEARRIMEAAGHGQP